MGATHPDGTVGFQDALTARKPFAVEFVVEFRAAGFVPIAFVHLDHAAGVTGDAAVGKEIGRVGEDGVETALRIFGGDGVQELEAIGMVEADERAVVAEDEIGSGLHRGHLGLRIALGFPNRSVVAEFEMAGFQGFGVGQVGGGLGHRAIVGPGGFGRALTCARGSAAGVLRFRLGRLFDRHAQIN